MTSIARGIEPVTFSWPGANDLPEGLEIRSGADDRPVIAALNNATTPIPVSSVEEGEDFARLVRSLRDVNGDAAPAMRGAYHVAFGEPNMVNSVEHFYFGEVPQAALDAADTGRRILGRLPMPH